MATIAEQLQVGRFFSYVLAVRAQTNIGKIIKRIFNEDKGR
jgi:hypothetical protein